VFFPYSRAKEKRGYTIKFFLEHDGHVYARARQFPGIPVDWNVDIMSE
jgi:hypothetical protein